LGYHIRLACAMQKGKGQALASLLENSPVVGKLGTKKGGGLARQRQLQKRLKGPGVTLCPEPYA